MSYGAVRDRVFLRKPKLDLKKPESGLRILDLILILNVNFTFRL